MKRGVWVAALALSLGGMEANGSGQDAGWRPVTRPAAPEATVRARSADPLSATLGRPVATTRGASTAVAETPRLFPTVYHGSRPGAVGRLLPGVEPIAIVPPPGAVIAASLPTTATWSGQQEEALQESFNGELFAMDRSARKSAKPALLPVNVAETQKLVNWQVTFPITPPQEETPHPEGVVQASFGADLPPTRWYARGEYLLWWTKNDKTPPLVTTGIPRTPDDTDVGMLGRPDTRVLFGGDLDRDAISGGRVTLGYYIDDCGEKAIEFSGFFLGQGKASFQSSSFENAVLTRPFLAVNPPPDGGETTQLVSFPGQVCGQVTISAPSELWGLEANLLCQWRCGCNWRIDPLVGFRYLRLNESLNINENHLIQTNQQTVQGTPSVLAGASLTVSDRFAATNQFYGAQVGIEGRWQQERWTLDGRAKLALGSTEQTLQIAGSQDLLDRNGVRTPSVGGLLALNSNIGRSSRTQFTAVPEFQVTAGYYLTERMRALVGYNFLYWSNVVRPGEQIDRGLDLNRIPNFLEPPNSAAPTDVARPARLFNTSDFWAQGVTIGLEYRY